MKLNYGLAEKGLKYQDYLKKCKEIFRLLNVSGNQNLKIDYDSKNKDMTFHQRVMIEIAQAMVCHAKILIMDSVVGMLSQSARNGLHKVYEEFPKPEAGEGEIVLKVKGCGICAGDVKAFHGGIRIWGTAPENRYIEAPCVGGHEFFGEVAEIGEGVTDYKIGDILVSEQIIPCKECEYCKKGVYWMCKRSAVFGFKQYANGGFAEYVKLGKNCLNHKVPEGFTAEQAVLIEPIACGMHAVERAQIQHRDVVVIAGLGAIGASMINITSLSMPKMVIGIDVRENRLEMGKKFGADVVLNPAKCNVAEEIKKLTNDLGCDVYIEASGSPRSVTQGMESLRNLGRYVQMGVFAEEVKADWNTIGDGKELTIIGSHLSGSTYDSVIKGIADGRIKTEGLITHTFQLEDWKEAFKTTEAADAMKIMLVP